MEKRQIIEVANESCLRFARGAATQLLCSTSGWWNPSNNTEIPLNYWTTVQKHWFVACCKKECAAQWAAVVLFDIIQKALFDGWSECMAGLSIVLSNNPSLSLRFHRNGALSWSSAEQSTEKEGAGEQRSRGAGEQRAGEKNITVEEQRAEYREWGFRGQEEQGSRRAESRRAGEKNITVEEQRADYREWGFRAAGEQGSRKQESMGEEDSSRRAESRAEHREAESRGEWIALYTLLIWCPVGMSEGKQAQENKGSRWFGDQPCKTAPCKMPL